MKERILVLLAVVLSLAYSQNMLQNPGFETWSGGMPEYWIKSDSVALFQEDVTVYAGNFSAKDSFFSTTAGNAELYQGMHAQPNTLYRISFWVHDNDPAGRARGGVQWFSGGVYVSSEWPNFYTVDSPSWQLWTSDLAVSPSNADSVRFVIRGYDVGTPWTGAIFYVDDAYFGPPATQPPTIIRSWHTPTNPAPGVTVDIYGYVLDNGTVEHDTLFYGVNSLVSPSMTTHISVSNDTFHYQIAGQSSGDTVFYYLKYVDDDGLSAVSDTHAYYVGAVGLYVNEFYYDTPGADSGCFIEIYGAGNTSLDGITLVGVNGNGGVDYATIDLNGYTIPGDGFFVVGEFSSVPNVDLVDSVADLQNGPDNVELRYHGITIDAVGYGVLNGWVFTGEWMPAADVEAGYSLGRYPDGEDTDNNGVDFNSYDAPTPGTPNPPVGINENRGRVVELPLPNVASPVRSGIAYRMLINSADYYPLTIYNAMGQKFTEIKEPDHELQLPTGVYFIRFVNIEQGGTKIVVVK
ncbi:MAG: hypothetical protein OEV79_01275 [candidate division WOR-3 bacterium]|nr:hypothetical protein [candidate division WOR-3 bacterium]